MVEAHCFMDTYIARLPLIIYYHFLLYSVGMVLLLWTTGAMHAVLFHIYKFIVTNACHKSTLNQQLWTQWQIRPAIIVC